MNENNFENMRSMEGLDLVNDLDAMIEIKNEWMEAAKRQTLKTLPDFIRWINLRNGGTPESVAYAVMAIQFAGMCAVNKEIMPSEELR